MSLPNVLSRVQRRGTSSPRRHLKPGRQERSFVPRLELLEDRTVLSTWTVTNSADSDDGSLRAAIAAAQGGDQIVFDTSLNGQTITLTSGELVITHSLDIEGPGADKLAISGNDASRVFDIIGGTVMIAGLTITHGRADGSAPSVPSSGGGILNVGGTVNLSGVVLSDSQAIAQPLGAGPFTQILAFGDSFTETGNVFASTGNTFPDPNYYYYGRWSNGPVWVERLASDLAVPNPTPSLLGGTNYGWGGAETGLTGVSTVGTPTIGSQITDYLHSHSTLRAGQLIVVWGGANDFIHQGQTNPSIPVSNLAQEITMLAQHGGKSFLVPNLPPLGEFPDFKNPQTEAKFNLLASQFNSLLASQETTLETTLGITIFRFDDASLFEQILNDPAAFGFTNVTQPAKSGDRGGPGTVVSNPDQYLFWDTIHPTRAAHQIMGDAVFYSIGVPGGDARGGGIFNGAGGILTVSHCTLTHNLALGSVAGPGGNAGSAYGGGIASVGATTTITDSTLSDNQALGGAGGAGAGGGNGLGGGIANTLGGTVTIVNSTLNSNQALGGAGGAGASSGNGLGGGLYNDATSQATFVGSMVTENRATGGAGGAAGQGMGGGIYIAMGGKVSADTDTLIAMNHASTSDDDVFGTLFPP